MVAPNNKNRKEAKAEVGSENKQGKSKEVFAQTGSELSRDDWRREDNHPDLIETFKLAPQKALSGYLKEISKYPVLTRGPLWGLILNLVI